MSIFKHQYKYLKYRTKYLQLVGQNGGNKQFALILPHAGIYYNKPIFDYIFRNININSFDLVILLSTSHYSNTNQFFSSYDEFENINKTEHSPISVKDYINKIPVEIHLIAEYNQAVINDVVNKCKNKKVLLIANSDLLHCGSNFKNKCPVNIYEYNKKIITDLLENKISDDMCGKNAIRTFLQIIANFNCKYVEHVYSSSDIIDKQLDSSVGYVGIVFDSTFNNNNFLLSVCKTTLEDHFTDRKTDYKIKLEIKDIIGMFVTLKINGELRGCIGTFNKEKDIIGTLRDFTLNSALRDSRFNPITKNEVKNITYEITLLKKPFETKDVLKDFIAGLHGITIYFEYGHATFVADVMIEHDEFGMKENEKLNTNKLEIITEALRRKVGASGEIKKIELYECITIK